MSVVINLVTLHRLEHNLYLEEINQGILGLVDHLLLRLEDLGWVVRLVADTILLVPMIIVECLGEMVDLINLIIRIRIIIQAINLIMHKAHIQVIIKMDVMDKEDKHLIINSSHTIPSIPFLLP